MSNIHIPLLPNEEEMQLSEKILRWEPALANGEDMPEFYLDTTNVGSLDGNLQASTAQDPFGNAQVDWNSLGDILAGGDFAAFTATADDLASTQKRVSFSQLLADDAEYPGGSTAYPPVDELDFSSQPHFGDSHQGGHYGVFRSNETIQRPALDSYFLSQHYSAEHEPIWNEILAENPLSQFDVDQAWQQAMASSGDIWNACPALHELPSPELEQFGLQPPPLPLHSKPGRPLLISGLNAPVADMVPRAISSLRSVSGCEDSPTENDCIDPTLAPTQDTRKRKVPTSTSPDSKRRKMKAPTNPLDDSDNEVLPLSVSDKKQKIQEASIKMAYVQGSFRQVPPGQRINPRTTAIQQTEELNKKYDQIPSTENWSSFKYSATGEVNMGDLLTPSDIQRYLYDHPLHNLPSGIHDKKNSGLRLWIQRNPADSARRYPSHQANRCRFIDCLATNNVINQGHLRVCFDEQTHLGLNNNPFFAAAYVHLNCLERFLDLPAICRDLNISPENRNLPHEPRGRNRMMLSPDSSTHIAHSFIRKCENGTLKGYPKNARPHEGTLVWQLMSNKVAEESHIFRRQEAKRGEAKASRVNVHLGDLELEAQNRDKTRRVKYQVDRKDAATKKRKARDESESESNGDSESQEEAKTNPKKKYTKRGCA
ncbi:MAG: hypothetical protein Q9208_002469 [Pyrenodesmia sp. 3 TL-2023]